MQRRRKETSTIETSIEIRTGFDMIRRLPVGEQCQTQVARCSIHERLLSLRRATVKPLLQTDQVMIVLLRLGRWQQLGR
jgi:hypothetical protein